MTAKLTGSSGADSTSLSFPIKRLWAKRKKSDVINGAIHVSAIILPAPVAQLFTGFTRCLVGVMGLHRLHTESKDRLKTSLQ